MSRVKRRAEPDRRERLAEQQRIMLRYARMVGASGPTLGRFTATLDALDAGLPVVVGHGWQIDLPAEPGPLVLEPDGSVEPVTAVYVDPDARPRTVSHYVRADGSSVVSP